MIGPRPCTYACAYFDPVFTSQAKRKTNLSVFLVLMLMLICGGSFHLLTHVLVLMLMLMRQ